MKKVTVLFLTMLIGSPGLCRGQVSGNVAYSGGGGKARAEQIERNKRLLTEHEVPPSGSSMFVDASVLVNVKADEYVAMFAVAQEGATVAECSQKMDATLKTFVDALTLLKIDADDLFVDFVAQNRVYGFEVKEDVAREKVTGFELKKNVSIRYADQALLDKIIVAAAQAEIFDLVKVDYIVKDTSGIQDKLMEEAARVIKHKTGRYERLLGIKLQPPVQVYAERPAVHYPTQMYDSYAAFESEAVGSSAYRQRYIVHGARKSTTFFFNGLDADGFDAVINPSVIEPVVQFTLYLKMKYEVEGAKAPAPNASPQP